MCFPLIAGVGSSWLHALLLPDCFTALVYSDAMRPQSCVRLRGDPHDLLPDAVTVAFAWLVPSSAVARSSRLSM